MTTTRRKRPRDPVQLGKLIVDIATGQVDDVASTGKDPAAAELGRLGGIKGGKARAKILSAERRVEIARDAALARHARTHKNEPEA